MRFADLDGVTIDGFGTLVGLRDPVARLSALTGRDTKAVQAAFETEMAYYIEHSLDGSDEASLRDLHTECTRVFSGAVGVQLSVEQYISALEYEVLPGVREALTTLRSRGLALAVVANWDCALPRHLGRLGIDRFFTAIVTSAETGVAKPDARIFQVALERLGVERSRAMHIGDSKTDEHGAAAAGLGFAPAPLAQAVSALA